MNIMGMELEPGAIGAIAFVCICLWLLIYRVRHHAKRRETLEKMMPQLGFDTVNEPSAKELVPDLLFHPNGLGSSDQNKKTGHYIDLQPRVPSAWQGRIASHGVIIMDVEVDRSRASASDTTDRKSGPGSWTVLRWAPRGKPQPPDLLIAERVSMSNNPPPAARAINGPARIGKHYFVFSNGSDEALEPWITPALRDVLDNYRLWKIAVHQGTFYLTMSSSTFIQPRYMQQFLQEGEAILSALVADK